MAIPELELCPCGRNLPLVSNVVGRVNDNILGSGGVRFHSFVFSYILKDVIALGIPSRQIRFVQIAPGEIEAQVSCDSEMFPHLEFHLFTPTIILYIILFK